MTRTILTNAKLVLEDEVVTGTLTFDHDGIVAVDTRVASASAVELLKLHGVSCAAGTVVHQILNRRGDGPCPMEKATMPFADVATGIQHLRDFIAARRAGLPLPP